MKKNVKITQSPFESNIQIADYLVLALSSCRDDGVELIVNPFITDYKENSDQPGIKSRQSTLIEGNHEDGVIQRISLDLTKNRQKDIVVDDKKYIIELLTIHSGNIPKEDWPYCEILISDETE